MTDGRFSRRALGEGCFGLALAGCAAEAGRLQGKQRDVKNAALEVGQEFPDFELTSFDGRPLRLEALRGTVVLLDLWASWCAPCQEELPVLDDIARRLQSQGVAVLGVSLDEERSNAQQFLSSRPRWQVQFFHDPKGKVAERLAPSTMPSSYLVDRGRVLRAVNVGFHSGDGPKLERQLRDLAAVSASR